MGKDEPIVSSHVLLCNSLRSMEPGVLVRACLTALQRVGAVCQAHPSVHNRYEHLPIVAGGGGSGLVSLTAPIYSELLQTAWAERRISTWILLTLLPWSLREMFLRFQTSPQKRLGCYGILHTRVCVWIAVLRHDLCRLWLGGSCQRWRPSVV